MLIVLEKVCRFLGGHPGLPIGTVSVNMTGQQILDSTFIRRIEENLEKYRLDGSRLRIEITERTVTDDFAEVRKVMECLVRPERNPLLPGRFRDRLFQPVQRAGAAL